MPHEEPDNSPSPEGSSASGTQEIEQLLAQAESLVKDIAGAVGVEPPAIEGEGLPTPMPEEPDALSVVEMAAVQVEELERTVDAEAPSPAKGAAAPAAVPDALKAFESDRGGDPPEKSAGRAPAAVEPSRDGSEPRTGRAAPIATPGRAIRQAVTPSGVALEEKPPIESAAAPEAAAEVETESAAGEPVAQRRKGGLARRAAMSIVMALRNTAVAVPNGALRLVILLNRPLAGLSPRTRTIIGLIGLASLLMGGLALVLPKMAQENPYVNMKPYAE